MWAGTERLHGNRPIRRDRGSVRCSRALRSLPGGIQEQEIACLLTERVRLGHDARQHTLAGREDIPVFSSIAILGRDSPVAPVWSKRRASCRTSDNTRDHPIPRHGCVTKVDPLPGSAMTHPRGAGVRAPAESGWNGRNWHGWKKIHARSAKLSPHLAAKGVDPCAHARVSRARVWPTSCARTYAPAPLRYRCFNASCG